MPIDGHQLHVARAGRADQVARHHQQQADEHAERGLHRRHGAAAERDAEPGAADRAGQPVRNAARPHVGDDGGGETDDEHDLWGHSDHMLPKAPWMTCQNTV